MFLNAITMPAPAGSGNRFDSSVFHDHVARFAEFYGQMGSAKRVARILSRTKQTVYGWFGCEVPTAGARFAAEIERFELAGKDTAPMRRYLDRIAAEARAVHDARRMAGGDQ